MNDISAEDDIVGAIYYSKYWSFLPVAVLLIIFVIRISFIIYKSKGQKTRRPQERRMYVGSRSRPSLTQQEPTIYVSPSNYPPPPKYEAMAPPSYEEVCGVHYPTYQPSIQPITQPITAAMTEARNETSTVITVTSENRRTSVAVAST